MLESIELEFLRIVCLSQEVKWIQKRENLQPRLPLLHQISYGWLNALDGNHHRPWPADRRE